MIGGDEGLGQFEMAFMLGSCVLRSPWLCFLLRRRVLRFLLQSYTMSLVLRALASAFSSVFGVVNFL